jgi:hypothetical protein
MWHNALFLFRQMNGIVSHIYREGNQVADALTNHDGTLASLACWYDVPLFIIESFVKNQRDIPSFRICTS